MPQAIAYVAAAVANWAAGYGLSYAGVYAVTYVGLTAAVTYGASALAQSAAMPDIETAKGSQRQPIPPRIRAYGRRRLGGYYLLWEAQRNYAYDVVAFQSDRAETIETVLSHNAKLVIDPVTGWVSGDHGYGGGDGDLIHVETRVGLPTETPYAAIVAALGPSGIWPENARGDGLATLGADYHHAKKENLLADYQNGDPIWSVIGRWSMIWDPRIAGQDRLNIDKEGFVHRAEKNRALIIMDFCCHETGMAMDYETEIAPALTHWMGEANICDEHVPKKDGTVETRYWGSIFYAFHDDPQNTLDKLRLACDGKVFRDEFGVSRLWVGKYREPTIHLTAEDIVSYDLEMDSPSFDVVNEIVPKFVSENDDWSMVPAAPWRDQADVDMRSKAMSQDMPLEACNSGPMATRLAKREVLRQTAPLRGKLIGKLSCIRALGHRWIYVDIPDLGMERIAVELIEGGKTSFADGSVTLPFVLARPEMDEWDPETEEDDTPAPPKPEPEPVNPPTFTSVTPFFDSLGGGEGARLHCVGVGPDRSDLTWYIQWRVAGSTSFAPAEVTDDTPGAGFSGDSGFVPSDTPLEVQIGFHTGGGATHWSETQTVTAATAGLAPPSPIGLSTAEDAGDLIIRASAPNVSRIDHLRFHLGTPGSAFADATDIGTAPATPGQLVEFNAGPQSPGTRLIWVTAETVDDLASVPAGPVSFTA